MTVRVATESSTLSASGTIAGEIWLDFGEEQFPCEGWSDLVVVVLEQWFDALPPLVAGTGRTARMLFFDGPYEGLVTARSSDIWEAELVRRNFSHNRVFNKFEFAPRAFIKSLLDASKHVLNGCARRQWKDPSIDALMQARDRFQHYPSVKVMNQA